nr:DUF4124 domain-containing protein [uncultured Pseudoxanthomonas sp.]
MSLSARSTFARLTLLVLFWVTASSAARADEVTIYRCTDASGALTLQNSPCPKGMKQEARTMQGVNTVPMAPAPPATSPASPAQASPATATPAPVAPAVPATASTTRALPPPVLFQCTTHDKDTYVTEDSEPASRCVTLRTVGLDGNPQSGAGQACEVVRDTCARVPDGALCEAWRKRLDETEVAWRFARRENVERNRAEHERVTRIVSGSNCGQ